MKSSRGFTIVELLIVIVVIGILAAIVIVAFNGVQSRAHDTAMRSDLASFAKKMGLYHAEYGSYPAGLSVSMDISFTRSAYLTTTNNIYFCVKNDSSSYALTVQGRTGTRLAVTPSGIQDYTGGWGGTTTCDHHFGTGNAVLRNHGYNTATTPNWQSWVAGS